MTGLWRRRLRVLPGLFAALWNLSLVLVRGLVPLLLLGMVGLLAWALLVPQPWPFSITAETEHATLVLAPGFDTQWRVGGATLCVRRQLAPLPLPPTTAPRCAGGRWQAYDLGASPEATLLLPAVSPTAASPTGATASLDMESDGALAVQVTGGAARLLPAPGVQLSLGDRLILVFDPPPPAAPPGRLLLPFAGGGMLGRDVIWSEPSLLRQGEILLYTRSDEAAGGRDLVATTNLLPGDRVDLGQGGAEGRRGATPVTKGFVHVDLLPAPSAPPVMRVVAFGEAESVRILRFGEQGYSVSPGLLARISRHSAVATWAVLIFTLLGLITLYQGCATLGQGTLPDCWQDVRARLRGLRAPFGP